MSKISLSLLSLCVGSTLLLSGCSHEAIKPNTNTVQPVTYSSAKQHKAKVSHPACKSTQSVQQNAESVGFYKIKAGDTLSGIARMHTLSLKEEIQCLKKANHLKHSDKIRVGKKLYIPSAKVCRSKYL
tara:strand:+ start:73 stop:456 length:384 start_codon:yes stop_codon:yes gene_type:complete